MRPRHAWMAFALAPGLARIIAPASPADQLLPEPCGARGSIKSHPRLGRERFRHPSQAYDGDQDFTALFQTLQVWDTRSRRDLKEGRSGPVAIICSRKKLSAAKRDSRSDRTNRRGHRG